MAWKFTSDYLKPKFNVGDKIIRKEETYIVEVSNHNEVVIVKSSGNKRTSCSCAYAEKHYKLQSTYLKEKLKQL